MTNRNKQRGYELEKETVDFWKSKGIAAKRVFASGQYKHLGPEFEGDLMLAGYTVECKRKKTGFKFLYDSLAQDDSDMLVVREDRNHRIYIMTEETVLALFNQIGLVNQEGSLK